MAPCPAILLVDFVAKYLYSGICMHSPGYRNTLECDCAPIHACQHAGTIEDTPSGCSITGSPNKLLGNTV